MNGFTRAFLLLLLLHVSACSPGTPTLTVGEVDYDKPFHGTMREDVKSFTEVSGLMDTPEWPLYAIGYSRYLEFCTDEDLYHQKSICNLKQLEGVRARTLFWQFLTTSRMIVEEDAHRFHAEMIYDLQEWESRKLDGITFSDWVEEFSERAHYIERIEEIKRTKDAIESLKDQMP